MSEEALAHTLAQLFLARDRDLDAVVRPALGAETPSLHRLVLTRSLLRSIALTLASGDGYRWRCASDALLMMEGAPFVDLDDSSLELHSGAFPTIEGMLAEEAEERADASPSDAPDSGAGASGDYLPSGAYPAGTTEALEDSD